jgi:hypothetical protein
MDHKAKVLAIILVVIILVVSLTGFYILNSHNSHNEKIVQSSSIPRVISTSFNRSFTDLLDQYGNTGTGWTGSDGTYSIQLSNGSILWIFSDTFLGQVSNGSRNLSESELIHNTLVLEKGNVFGPTYYSEVNGSPDAYFSPQSSAYWYWPGFAIIYKSDIQVILTEYDRSGSGEFDFKQVGTSVAVINQTSLKLLGIYPLNISNEVNWAAFSVSDNGYTYIYGANGGSVCLARTDQGLLGKWQFYANGNWSDNSNNHTQVLFGADEAFGVTYMNGYYILITESGLSFNSGIIQFYYSSNPWGPFNGGYTIYNITTPGKYPASYQVYSYNAMIQPEFTHNDTLLVSYNVNAENYSALANVSIYRPRFINVNLSFS